MLISQLCVSLFKVIGRPCLGRNATDASFFYSRVLGNINNKCFAKLFAKRAENDTEEHCI